mmetsp:Transcript_55879/g.76261  ORF Transcript_55879/g.76261 Transcript_55879/m.76261 type:complete len:91 (+) Transcript_55879:121-393(+)|eukprot:CAMPEP_0185748560 /NCGR_PEP_ID=MMETSP1174-20130828/7266_1 /TAXON_ID=35687 /ORGANISM="Dictyocha speculum, Strain CCMP1381" /LENGTH=90 /DNA_ID=CAMNT_0028424303 /DNA_START=139 /DNA_END=411 /DNA_ORIENTATION=-
MAIVVVKEFAFELPATRTATFRTRVSDDLCDASAVFNEAMGMLHEFSQLFKTRTASGTGRGLNRAMGNGMLSARPSAQPCRARTGAAPAV